MIYHNTVPQLQAPERSLRLEDLRKVVGTDKIVDELMGDLVSNNPSLTSASTHLFSGSLTLSCDPMLQRAHCRSIIFSRGIQTIYYVSTFSGGGKYFRPTCVMLMGEACNIGHSPNSSQREIALITELIHVASLVHDDVLDSAATRRTLRTVNSLFNEKVAILSGDFIIARATSKLARLGCTDTIRILSSVIRDLIKGEIRQLNAGASQEDQFALYLDKTYLKTASLIAHGCQAVVLNSGRPHLQHTAFEYGKNLGIAFQLVDDMLDFISTSRELGKAAGSDLKLGLATAPVLYASLSHPRLLDLIARSFSRPGDVEQALELVADSKGIERTRALAEGYAERALRDVEKLPQCEFSEGLNSLCEIVISRTS